MWLKYPPSYSDHSKMLKRREKRVKIKAEQKTMSEADYVAERDKLLAQNLAVHDVEWDAATGKMKIVYRDSASSPRVR